MSEPTRPRTVTLNVYGATCVRCGYWVHEENGELLDKDPSTDKWRVVHLKGLCHAPTSASDSSFPRLSLSLPPRSIVKKRRVMLPTGEEPWEQQHGSDRAEEEDRDEEFVPGSENDEEHGKRHRRTAPARLVELESPYLPAQLCEGLPHQLYCVNTSKYRSSLHQDRFLVRLDAGTGGRLRFQNAYPESNHHVIPAATSRILVELIREQGVERCAKKYASVTGNCYRCNRKLTDEVSVRHGLGPVCRGEKDPCAPGPRARIKQRAKAELDDGDVEDWSSCEEDGSPKNEMSGFIVQDGEEEEEYREDEDDDEEEEQEGEDDGGDQ